VNYLSSTELKKILVVSNQKNLQLNESEHEETRICKEENNKLQFSHNNQLEEIIEEKKKKSDFLKKFLRKVF
jgi:hypothetical protein